jgi:hypothetical protein
VAGIEIVLHLAGIAKGDEVKAAHLVRAGSQAGVVQLTYRPVGTYEPLPSPAAEAAPQGSGKRFGEDRQPCRHRNTDKGGNR